MTQNTQILTSVDERRHSPVIESIGHLVTMVGTVRASAITCMENDICDEETGALYI